MFAGKVLFHPILGKLANAAIGNSQSVVTAGNHAHTTGIKEYFILDLDDAVGGIQLDDGRSIGLAHCFFGFQKSVRQYPLANAANYGMQFALHIRFGCIHRSVLLHPEWRGFPVFK